MACPLCALAQPLVSFDIEGAPRNTTPVIDEVDAKSLALQACDETDSFREVLCAYACVEKLIAPLEVSDTEQLNPSRSELSALLRLVNDEFRRRIETVDKTVHAMRATLMTAPAN